MRRFIECLNFASFRRDYFVLRARAKAAVFAGIHKFDPFVGAGLQGIDLAVRHGLAVDVR